MIFLSRTVNRSHGEGTSRQTKLSLVCDAARLVDTLSMDSSPSGMCLVTEVQTSNASHLPIANVFSLRYKHWLLPPDGNG